ncbi:hypothetical protein D6774_04060 [Candidatus Woesearchaeota archaeon]|nr:MAG: hypothetical protein D6774_04060 [Candidatus Woesearchaeota archaeon]
MRFAENPILTHSFQVSGRSVVGVVDYRNHCSVHWFYTRCDSFEDYVKNSADIQTKILKHPRSRKYAHPFCAFKQQVYFNIPIMIMCKSVEPYENTLTLQHQKLYRMHVEIGSDVQVMETVLGPLTQDTLQEILVQLQSAGPQKLSLPAFKSPSSQKVLCDMLIETLNPSRYQLL